MAFVQKNKKKIWAEIYGLKKSNIISRYSNIILSL